MAFPTAATPIQASLPTAQVQTAQLAFNFSSCFAMDICNVGLIDDLIPGKSVNYATQEEARERHIPRIIRADYLPFSDADGSFIQGIWKHFGIKLRHDRHILKKVVQKYFNDSFSGYFLEQLIDAQLVLGKRKTLKCDDYVPLKYVLKSHARKYQKDGHYVASAIALESLATFHDMCPFDALDYHQTLRLAVKQWARSIRFRNRLFESNPFVYELILDRAIALSMVDLADDRWAIRKSYLGRPLQEPNLNKDGELPKDIDDARYSGMDLLKLSTEMHLAQDNVNAAVADMLRSAWLAMHTYDLPDDSMKRHWEEEVPVLIEEAAAKLRGLPASEHRVAVLDRWSAEARSLMNGL